MDYQNICNEFNVDSTLWTTAILYAYFKHQNVTIYITCKANQTVNKFVLDSLVRTCSTDYLISPQISLNFTFVFMLWTVWYIVLKKPPSLNKYWYCV